MELSLPFPNSYWVYPGRVLAGEHPSLGDPSANRERVRRLLQAGISVFLDLTEPHETAGLELYADLAQSLQPAGAPELEFYRLAIPDMQVPSVAEMQSALDLLDAALSRRRALYVHCWGGIGRTGTLVGCYLVRHGVVASEALAELARLRQHTPDSAYPAPARNIQRQMVCAWQSGM